MDRGGRKGLELDRGRGERKGWEEGVGGTLFLEN